MKAIKFLLISCLISFALISNAQDLEDYNSDFDYCITGIPQAIYNEEKCKTLINKLDDISDGVEELLNGNDLEPGERTLARALKQKAGAVENFLRTVGNSSYIKWDMKESELEIVKELIPVEIVRVSAGKYCVEVYAIRLGKYVCWVAFKPGGNDIYTVTAKLASPGGSKRYSSQMGLQGNRYRALWNNADNLNQKSVLINSISCTRTSSSLFLH